MTIFLVLVCAGCVLGGSLAVAAPAQRPNVLFIAAADMRPQLGCYGEPCCWMDCSRYTRRWPGASRQS